MTAKSPESINDTANVIKNDELLRYLHILDTLAYDSLVAQLKYFEKEIINQSPSTIKNLKWIATKKFLCFFEVKRSLLKSSDFIDINKFNLSNKNVTFDNIIRRSNLTHFFNLLFANFDPAVPDFQNVDATSFFSYIVPPNLIKTEEIWDLDLNLRVQIYISKINKDPQQRNLYKVMFPNIEDGDNGPPIYKETYINVRNIIERNSDDSEMLLKEFKWGKFVDDMFKCLSNIFNRINELEMPLLYKYTSIETPPIPSSSSSTNSAKVVIFGDVLMEEVDNNVKKRRLADEEEDEAISSDNIGDNLGDSSSVSKKEEIEQIMSYVDISGSQSIELNADTELKRTKSDLLPNSDDESLNSPSIRRITRNEHENLNSNRRATFPMQKQIECSSSSLASMIVDQHESVDDRQSSSEESLIEGSPLYEQIGNSPRRTRSKRKAINYDYDETKRVTKRNKVMWTDQELSALEDGMRRHGKQWSIIKSKYGKKGQILENRTASKLKDKARSEFTRRQRDGIETGVFGIMESS
ncbi:hypothetical protein RclHR1_02270014 [Rhizophagus clarus]|uniref:Myb-like domain-containing protein n=1 Tax=Rhizophagus clarus TaxID=94130 RepID=A0A2Z6QVL7_9GLOM|nr:hypothetical protein RclHR1_02270014 [Rhizophagus clarus]GET01748.1 hypothetical protein GLOIN_2v1507326 [Rhizophagus clarus]